MAQLGFKKRFAPVVELGLKRQTIRRTRKDIYPGKALQLFVGLRTKSCRKLVKDNPFCTRKAPIFIDKNEIILDGLWLNGAAREIFARADGFDNADAFFEFFRREYALPFGMDGRGAEVIYW